MVKFKTACTLCTFEYSVSFCSHLHFTSPTPRRWRVLKFLFTFTLRLERLLITCCFSNLLLCKFIPFSLTHHIFCPLKSVLIHLNLFRWHSMKTERGLVQLGSSRLAEESWSEKSTSKEIWPETISFTLIRISRPCWWARLPREWWSLPSRHFWPTSDLIESAKSRFYCLTKKFWKFQNKSLLSTNRQGETPN